ncbi:MAG: hypothetical protein NVS2B16_31450 [Chloroflexota bacterium]
MECPCCASHMKNITLAEARGAEYRAGSVTIWRCPECHAPAGAEGARMEWLT